MLPRASITGFLFSLLGLITGQLAAQSNETNHDISRLVSLSDTLRNRYPREKLYLHLDKPAYALGDTIWLKAYLSEAAYGTPSPLSGILYVELIGAENEILERLRLPVVHGLARGDLVLDGEQLGEGTCLLRAYTNWMQNFGEDHFFQKEIRISGTGNAHWLVQASPPRRFEGEKADSVQMVLQLIDPGGESLAGRPVELSVVSGRRTLLSNTAPADEKGKLDINFTLPSRQRDRELVLRIGEEGEQRAVLPLRFADVEGEQADVQFMPEGGHLVAGLPARMGIKVTGPDGKGLEAEGVVLDEQQKEIARFRTLYKGMGVLALPPLPPGSYTARVHLPGGGIKNVPLPELLETGTVLQVLDKPGSDSVHLVLRTSPGLNPGTPYTLTGASRGMVLYAAALKFTSPVIETAVPKAIFPSGIARFTLLGPQRQPLNERICFVDHRKNLEITIEPGKPVYHPRDSVVLEVSVRDTLGEPAEGSFSLAVTDDRQVRPDTSQETILSSFLLSSDLKGPVEAPGYYFTGTDSARQALDALMLTQGWVKYEPSLLETLASEPDFEPEPAFRVQGRVRNAFNKPVKNSNVVLFASGKFPIVADTVTNTNGEFVFADLPPFDTTAFKIQARNRRGKSFNVGVEVDEFKPAPLPDRPPPSLLPWYVNTDSTIRHYVKDHATYRRELNKQRYGVDFDAEMLEGVTVTSTRIINGSHNLNGPGNADQIIDEEELEKAGKATLLDVLEEKVDGFRTGTFPPKSQQLTYMVRDKGVRLVIDGVDVDFFYEPFTGQPNEYMQYLRDYLNYYSAEDVIGIEVMYSMRYNSAYHSRFLEGMEIMNVNPVTFDYVYLEITTRAGSGPFQKKTPGVYLYKPIPFYWPREFYAPRYPLENPDLDFTDLRSTIHWEPDLVTDSAGKARVSFFAADRPGTYTVILEGSDMQGSFGTQRARIVIRQDE